MGAAKILSVLIFLVSSPAGARPARSPASAWCAALLSHFASRSEGRLVDRSTPEAYSVFDPTHPDFAVSAAVHNEVLEFSIQTVTPEGLRSNQLNAQQQLDRIFAHFDGRFTAVDSDWFQTVPCNDPLCRLWPTFSVNLERFNQGIREGLTPKAAALSTWTGRQMQKRGFGVPVILSLEGEPGFYQSVQVRFGLNPVP